MSFRNELKSILSYSKKNIFDNWLKKNFAKKIYPERKINSIYLDNSKLSMYFDSVEGVLPRKKIRIRTYNNFCVNNNNYNLEFKISSFEGRFKTSKKLDKFDLNSFRYLDNQYGFCSPKIYISYKRNYYKIRDFRVTLDADIEYKKIINGKIYEFSYREKNFIIEIKYDYYPNDKVFELFPFSYNRFSKYCNAIELLLKK